MARFEWLLWELDTLSFAPPCRLDDPFDLRALHAPELHQSFSQRVDLAPPALDVLGSIDRSRLVSHFGSLPS